jgi:hypothetical protein
VDLSRDLRRALIELRDERLLEAFQHGKNDIADDLVFRSPEGAIIRTHVAFNEPLLELSPAAFTAHCFALYGASRYCRPPELPE